MIARLLFTASLRISTATVDRPITFCTTATAIISLSDEAGRLSSLPSLQEVRRDGGEV